MKKLNLVQLQEKLEELKRPVFTPQDIKLFFNPSDRALNAFLSYNSKKNRLIKLKKALYGLKTKYTNPLLIANRAYQPSYISFETALSYYHLIPEIVYSITSATSKASRLWSIQQTSYVYRKIKQEAFNGYIAKTIENVQVVIALPEKALADYCYFIYLGKIKDQNNRLKIRNINLDKFKIWLDLFNNEGFKKFIKKYLSTGRQVRLPANRFHS